MNKCECPKCSAARLPRVQAPLPLGELQILEVFRAVEGPLLYSAVLCDMPGRERLTLTWCPMLGMWVDETPEEDIWFFAMVTPARMERLYFGTVDLRSAFTDSEGGYVYVWHQPKEGGAGRVDKVSVICLDPKCLPAAGVLLREQAGSAEGPEQKT